MNIFFFFSSRRRHTRFKCDWSSDVCSSDLALLVFETGDGKVIWCGEVNRVNHTVAEGEKRGEDVARQSGQEKIEEHRPSRPSRPSRHTRPGLHNRPPEEKTGSEETCMFDHVPRF